MTAPAAPGPRTEPARDPRSPDPRSPAPRAPARRRLAILAVDDSASDLRILSRVLASIPQWEVELQTCQGPAEFLAALDARTFDVLLVDYTLGSVGGVELLTEARKLGSSGPAIVLTVREDARSAVQALHAGAADFLSKDELGPETLKRAVEGAIERHNLQVALTEYRKRLERAKETLEKKNEEIRGFYRTIRSELTTPIATAIELLSDLIERNALAPDQRESIEVVRDTCQQIAVALDDVLDTGRLESGRLALWVRCDDLGEVVERAIAALATRARSLGVALETRIAPGLEPAMIDRQRVSQVLANLVDRALEFVPAGGRIEVEASEDPFDAGFLDVSVTDTGPGLSAEEVQRALELFCRGDDPASPAVRAGVPHGLRVCHEIVRLHGGELSVESEPGKRTTFSFTLPKAISSESIETSGAF